METNNSTKETVQMGKADVLIAIGAATAAKLHSLLRTPV